MINVQVEKCPLSKILPMLFVIKLKDLIVEIENGDLIKNKSGFLLVNFYKKLLFLIPVKNLRCNIYLNNVYKMLFVYINH